MRHREADVAKAWDILGVNSADREKVENGHERALIVAANSGDPIGQPGIPLISVPAPVKKMSSILDAFAPDVRARTMLGVFVLGMQQMSGIDGILYVSSLSQGPKSKLTYV